MLKVAEGQKVEEWEEKVLEVMEMLSYFVLLMVT